MPAAASCTFFMLDANFVRSYRRTTLPFYQEIREKHLDAIARVTLDYTVVVNGTHSEKILSVSHRWMQHDEPDPDGEQLKAIKTFLNSPAGKKIELIWLDSACMPQDHPKGSRTAEDHQDFKRMLSEVNMLYLGTTVLILLDLSYVSRFWTQFESWLAMQYAMPSGLKPAVGTKNERHHIVCIHNAASQAELYTKALVENWANTTSEEAHAFLSKPDVTVTNQSDKDGQLPKIKELDATVQDAFKAISDRLNSELALSQGAEAASALEAKRRHETAVSLGVMPARMDWEKESAAAELKAAMPGRFGAINVAKLKCAVERARATGVDAADVVAAERELSEYHTACLKAAQAKESAAAELKAAMPGWFGAVDVPKLKSAVERARATGVDAADVDAAERELSKATAAEDAAAQKAVIDSAASALKAQMPGWFSSAIDVGKLASAIDRAKATGVDAATIRAAEVELQKEYDRYPWGRTSQRTRCASCGHVGVTNVLPEFAEAAAFTATVGCCLPLLVPGCLDNAKDVVHFCSNCGNGLGRNPGASQCLCELLPVLLDQ